MSEPQQQQQHHDEPSAPSEHPPADERRRSSPEVVVTWGKISYTMKSFYAIMQPVFITMVLSAAAVVYINTPQSIADGQEALSGYNVVNTSDNASSGQKLGTSLLNGLVIVVAICLMTFVVVLLYKYRCMKLLVGYMVVAMITLLGFLSATMFQIAIDRYQLHIDKISFYLTIYNFGVVGTASIFNAAGFGIAPIIGQFYLIAVSVIVAWQFSHFDDWTAWVLLVLLALYDLFAVLSPCGPLKALVKLMQRDGAPPMPGLLYEASIQPRRPPRTTTASTNAPPAASSSSSSSPGISPPNQPPPTSSAQSLPPIAEEDGESSLSASQEIKKVISTDQAPAAPPLPLSPLGTIPLALARLYKVPLVVETSPTEGEGVEVEEPSSPAPTTSPVSAVDENDLSQLVQVRFPATGYPRIEPYLRQHSDKEIRYVVKDWNGIPRRILYVDDAGHVLEDVAMGALEPTVLETMTTGLVPLAVAILYKLPLVEDPNPSWCRRRTSTSSHTVTEGTDEEEAAPAANRTASSVDAFTPEQLQREVPVIFRRNGRRIHVHDEQEPRQPTRYVVVSYEGQRERIVFVNNQGRVYQIDEESDGHHGDLADRDSIRLGLGDFIFYSILVSKAAVYGFTAFCTTVVAILAGLGLTLVILAIRGQALPALPISIFLGVVVYLFTRYTVEPWVESVFINECYV